MDKRKMHEIAAHVPKMEILWLIYVIDNM